MTAICNTQPTDTLSLAERELLHRQRNDTLGTLASGMAHELRNIVMPVLLRLDVLTASADLPESARSDVVSIRKSMRHLQHLAEGLRLLSSDASIQPVERPVTRLYNWWEDFRSVVVDTLPVHASVDGVFPESLPLAAVPQSVLAQSVMSLLLDALPAASSVAMPTVQLRVTEDVEHLRLSIVKNFCKIEAIPRPATSESTEMTPRETSMRFGLYASRELLRKYGGDLTRELDGDLVRVTITLRRVALVGEQQRIRVLVKDPRILAVVHLLMLQRGVTAIDSSDKASVDLIVCDSGALPAALRSAVPLGDTEIVVLGVNSDNAPVPVGVRWVGINDVGALYAAFG